MVKTYLRYEPAAAFGVIVSIDSNITYDSSGKHLIAPALEKIGVWNVRQGVCTKNLTPTQGSRGPSLAVTSVASAPSFLVSRFSNGEIYFRVPGFEIATTEHGVEDDVNTLNCYSSNDFRKLLIYKFFPLSRSRRFLQSKVSSSVKVKMSSRK